MNLPPPPPPENRAKRLVNMNNAGTVLFRVNDGVSQPFSSQPHQQQAFPTSQQQTFSAPQYPTHYATPQSSYPPQQHNTSNIQFNPQQVWSTDGAAQAVRQTSGPHTTFVPYSQGPPPTQAPGPYTLVQAPQLQPAQYFLSVSDTDSNSRPVRPMGGNAPLHLSPSNGAPPQHTAVGHYTSNSQMISLQVCPSASGTFYASPQASAHVQVSPQVSAHLPASPMASGSYHSQHSPHQGPPAQAPPMPLSLQPPPAGMQVLQAPTTAVGIPSDSVCKDFLVGKCTRANCRFVHLPPNVRPFPDDVCKDFLRGLCSRPMCRFFHGTAHELAQMKALQSQLLALGQQGSPPPQGSSTAPPRRSVDYSAASTLSPVSLPSTQHTSGHGPAPLPAPKTPIFPSAAPSALHSAVACVQVGTPRVASRSTQTTPRLREQRSLSSAKCSNSVGTGTDSPSV